MGFVVSLFLYPTLAVLINPTVALPPANDGVQGTVTKLATLQSAQVLHREWRGQLVVDVAVDRTTRSVVTVIGIVLGQQWSEHLQLHL